MAYRHRPIFSASRTQPADPDHGAQYLSQQIAIKCRGSRTRLVRRRPLSDNPRVRTRLQFYHDHYLIVITRAKPVPELPRPDIILAADCVYFEPAFPLLVSTLAALVPRPPERAPEVLFCYKKRRKADKRFFALLKKCFTWSVVRSQEPKKLFDTCALKLKVRSTTTRLRRRNIAAKQSRCSAYFAGRNGEGSRLLTTTNISTCSRILCEQRVVRSLARVLVKISDDSLVTRKKWGSKIAGLQTQPAIASRLRTCCADDDLYKWSSG